MLAQIKFPHIFEMDLICIDVTTLKIVGNGNADILCTGFFWVYYSSKEQDGTAYT